MGVGEVGKSFREREISDFRVPSDCPAPFLKLGEGLRAFLRVTVAVLVYAGLPRIIRGMKEPRNEPTIPLTLRILAGGVGVQLVAGPAAEWDHFPGAWSRIWSLLPEEAVVDATLTKDQRKKRT